MGRLIVIEGLDGSGKQTLTGTLAGQARAAGLAIATMAFPRYGVDVHADLVQDALYGRLGDLSDSVYGPALLFALDRRAAAQEIRDLLEQYDLVLGSRYLHGVNVVNWDFKRLLLSKGASLYVRMITSMPYSDATGGFKAWRRGALTAIGLDKLFSNGYLFQIETTYRLHQMKKFSIGEMSIIFRDRDLGRSKIDIHIILEAVWGVVRLRLTGR